MKSMIRRKYRLGNSRLLCQFKGVKMSVKSRLFGIGTFMSLMLSVIFAANPNPERIILNLTASPATSMAVNWRTEDPYPNSVIQYSVATPWIEYESQAVSLPAAMQKFEIGDDRLSYHYSTILKNLIPNTTYIYRVGHDSVWSEWNQFVTAQEKPQPFQFIFFGDPQNDDHGEMARVFRQAYRTAPNAGFWLFTGDLVNAPKDKLWDELFQAMEPFTRLTPSVMVPGNHDQLRNMVNSQRVSVTAPIWHAHLTLPENGIAGMEETSYFFDYQGVRFVMLNSNEKLVEQAVWLDSLLSHNPNRWTIAAFHHPFYSMGHVRDDRFTRDAFLTIFDKYCVDLVLQGHDHVYSRTQKLKGGKIVPDNQTGTVYIISASCPKAYDIGSVNASLMAKTGTRVQLFQVISVEPNRLEFKSYTANGSLFDEFELKK